MSASSLTNISPLQKQKFDYFCVLDFEATCEKDIRLQPIEIIEFPIVLLNAQTLTIEDEFHFYVRPVVHPTLTAFCTELTGIQQETVDHARPFLEVFKDFEQWFHQRPRSNGKPLSQFNCLFLTCGDWDLKTMLPIQCQVSSLEKPSIFNNWGNVKLIFTEFYGMKGLGMDDMLAKLGLPLKGRHHSGIDDCRNITQIVLKMIEDGCLLDYTTPKGAKFKREGFPLHSLLPSSGRPAKRISSPRNACPPAPPSIRDWLSARKDDGKSKVRSDLPLQSSDLLPNFSDPESKPSSCTRAKTSISRLQGGPARGSVHKPSHIPPQRLEAVCVPHDGSKWVPAPGHDISASSSSSKGASIAFGSKPSGVKNDVRNGVEHLVVHCMKSSYDVYIGRPNPKIPMGKAQCKWGNPFVIGKDGDRDEVIRKYEQWIQNQPDMISAAEIELKGKVLACWCSPQSCHGHVLARIANKLPTILP